jgi:sec-independent protein translocase protein TatC
VATAAVNAATGGGTGSEPVGEGRMPLVEHLRELRNRLVKAVLAIVAMMVVAWIFYDPLFALLTEPFESSIEALAAERDIDATLTLAGPADPFTLQIKIALVGGVVLSSPVWLYQLWAFVVPGLHRQERRWSMVFGAIAGPLFIAGVLLGFFILPKAIEILISFTPADVSNLVQVDRYLSFVLRMLLVFGIAFEIPLFVVLLNLAGVVSSETRKSPVIGSARNSIVIGSVEGVATAANTNVPITIHAR